MNSQHKVVKLSSTICAACISVISIIVSYAFNLTYKSWWPVFAFISLLVILYSFWFDIVLCKKEDNEKLKNDINNYKNQIINNAQIEAKKIIDNANRYNNEIENKCKKIIKEAEKIKTDKEFSLKLQERYLQLIKIHTIRVANFRKNYNEHTDSHVERMKKNNVEQYKINKYIKYRKKQYYQLDKPNIPDMEEKATIRFIIASLSDELESI